MANATFETLEDGKVKATATVDAVKVDEAVAKVYKDASKKYKVPGFRPGRAPRSILEGMIGDEYARAMATDEVVNNTFGTFVDMQGYRVIGQPQFDNEVMVEENKDFTYVVTFEVRPQLSLANTDVDITMPPREATDVEIDEQINSVRERFASLEKVRSRKIKKADHVMLSFSSTLDGEAYEGSEVEDYVYHLGQGMMPPQFEDAIIGAKPGETVTAEFEVEDMGDNVGFAGKAIRFEIELKEIQETKLPEVTDELAVQSGFKDIEDMRSEMATMLTDSKKNSYDNVLRQRMVAALVANLEGDVPAALLDDRQEVVKRDFINMLRENEMSPEEYLRMSGATFEDFEADMRKQAETAVRDELALEALAREKELLPTDQQFDEEMENIAGQLKTTVEVARERWEALALMTTLRDELARRNAVKWLEENATVTIDEMAFSDQK